MYSFKNLRVLRNLIPIGYYIIWGVERTLAVIGTGGPVK